jgi:hypothetical protein
MLRMPSKDCQAGKGYLKRAVLVQTAPHCTVKQGLPGPTLIAATDVIDKIGLYCQVLVVLAYC